MEDFNILLSNYLSPNNVVRSNAESQLNSILDRCDPNDLDLFFGALNLNYNPQIKLFLSLTLKKIFESCINENNISYYQNYVANRKGEIVNSILNVKADIKTVRILVLVLEKCMSLFKESNSNTLLPDEVFQYIFQFYLSNKEKGNLQETFQGLFISFKLLKILKDWEDRDKYDFRNFFAKFYEKIINDFSEVHYSFMSYYEGNTNIELSILIKYINLYLKIAKHSVNFLQKEQREKIMDITFNLLNKILFNLSSTLQSNNLVNEFNKEVYECIFLSNKILLKYTAHVSRIDINTLNRFSNLFYVYISETPIFENIINILRMDNNNFNNKNNTYKEHKFISDLIDFFKELLQLTAFDNWGDLVLFKDCFCDDSIAISDFLVKEFFTEDKIKNILIFAIKNCMIFNLNEIEMAQNDIEEFYIWYDTLSPIYDLREKAGLLCRIIFDKYKKSLKEFLESLEQNLVSLTDKELYQGGLNFEETNLKCAILYFFEALTYVFFNKHRNYDMWVNKILLSPLDISYVSNPNYEIFSRFIILRILTKTVDFKEITDYKPQIFMQVYNLFINLNSKDNGHMTLIKLAAIDFFYAFFDDYFSKECPQDFLKNATIQICDMLKTVSSPDIHNKIIKTTLTILGKFKDEEIEFAFPQIFSVIKMLWDSNWDSYTDNKNSNYLNKRNKNDNSNSISVVRQNLIKLISIFVKKIGIFVCFDQNSTSLIENDYFYFVYNMIGYSLSVKSKESSFLVQEALKLILLIQDEFYKLNCICANLSITKVDKPEDFYVYFDCYCKLYDFLPILLENLMSSDDYFLVQLYVLEQFMSLGYFTQIKNYFINIQFLDKLLIIGKNLVEKYLNTLPQPIFNFLEYCLYTLNYINNTSQDGIYLQVDLYNNFINQLISDIFSSVDCNHLLLQINQNLEKETSTFKVDYLDFDPPISQYNLLLGAIQLSNRLINSTNKQNPNLIFCYKLAEYINFITCNKNIFDGLSVLNRKIIVNLTNNLIEIFTQAVGNPNEAGLQNILKIFQESSGHFLDKYNHTLNHWLFFFNKMNNSVYYYQFTALEENLKNLWTSKLEKLNLNYFDVDLSETNFDLKYYTLLNDEMYKKENNGDDTEQEDQNNEETFENYYN